MRVTAEDGLFVDFVINYNRYLREKEICEQFEKILLERGMPEKEIIEQVRAS